MNIRFQNAAVFAIPAASSYIDGVLTVTNGVAVITIDTDSSGLTTVLPDQKTTRPAQKGDVLSVQPGGSLQGRTVVGPWEAGTQDPNLNVCRFSANGVTQALAFQSR